MREKMPVWKRATRASENMNVAVMGCIVNGPGESRHANIGIAAGTGEAPAAPVFVDGEKKVTLRGENIAQEFVALIDEYVESPLCARRRLRSAAGVRLRFPPLDGAQCLAPGPAVRWRAAAAGGLRGAGR
jgi:hypothetical protein